MPEQNENLLNNQQSVTEPKSAPEQLEKRPASGQPPEQRERLDLRELFGTDDDTDDDAPITNIDGVAKRLKLKPEDIYNLQVPMGSDRNNGEPMTIGQLKDRVGELLELDHRALEFDNRRIKQEGAIMQAQEEMRELMGLLPPEAIKPELIKRMRAQHAATVEREMALTMDHIPAWKDSAVYTKEVTQMREYLKRWGFSASMLNTVNDHRVLKFIRDSWLRDSRIEAALAKVAPADKPNGKPSGKSASAPSRMSAKNSTRASGTPDARARIMKIFEGH